MGKRIQHATHNINISITLMAFDAVASFIIRTLFIRAMLVEQLGLNGLFTDLSTMFSIAESGVGAAFSSVLYGAFHKNDKNRIKAIFHDLKKVYTLIALIEIAIGIVIYPIVKGKIIREQYSNLLIIYVLFVGKLFFTYLYSSYYTLIYADQKLFNFKRLCFVALFVRTILQLVAILYLKSFTVYFFASVVYAILPYFLLKNKVVDLYELKDYKNYKLDSKDRIKIKDRMIGGMIVHIAYIIFNGTDYLLITSFVGLDIAGIYSNYSMIVTIVTSVISSIFVALTSTVGDMLHDGNSEKIWENYKTLLFGNSILILGASICFIALFQPTIAIWAGENYKLSNIEMMLIVLVFCLGENGLAKATDAIRLSSGIYVKDKWYTFAAGGLNILLSLAMVKALGLSGILLGTVFSAFLYHVPAMYFVQKHVVKRSWKVFMLYYSQILVKNALIAIIALAVFFFVRHTLGSSILYLIVETMAMLISYLFGTCLMFGKSDEFRIYKGIIERALRSL